MKTSGARGASRATRGARRACEPDAPLARAPRQTAPLAHRRLMCTPERLRTGSAIRGGRNSSRSLTSNGRNRTPLVYALTGVFVGASRAIPVQYARQGGPALTRTKEVRSACCSGVAHNAALCAREKPGTLLHISFELFTECVNSHAACAGEVSAWAKMGTAGTQPASFLCESELGAAP